MVTRCQRKKLLLLVWFLTNFIRENSSEDSDFACDPHFVPIILERYNQYAAPSVGSTMEVNAATMDVFCAKLAMALAIAWNWHVMEDYSLH